ncbi:MAG: hypothetical protein Q4G59_08135, partial [Planctomycetia bacterium]|nr:hypothetical protein [Planctomycetia bacterium]
MNDNFRVAAGTLNLTPLDWEGNKNKIIAALTQFQLAIEDGKRDASGGVIKSMPGILCLSDLCLCGPVCED